MRVYRYQQEAIDWMVSQEHSQYRGGLLADEMGLGKTISVCGLYNRRPCVTLVICPVSLIPQWIQECERHTQVRPEVYTGQATTSPIVLVSDRYVARKGIFGFYNRVVLDEAHRIKSTRSKLFSGCYNIRCMYRWCLTGTPIVTSHIESLSLASTFTSSDSIAFLSFLQCPPATPLNAIMLRRLKKEVCRIEDIQQSLVQCTLSGSDADEYKRLYQQGQWIIQNRHTTASVLDVMMQLRLVCAVSRAKLEALEEYLDGIPPGSRILIFCHFHKEIQSVVDVCQNIVGMHTMQYHGKVPKKDRSDIVDAYMTPTCSRAVLVMQIDAGGVGLNLQETTHVLLMSPSWSAASEQQAVARAHRINTPHSVHVVRFLCTSTLEEFIHSRQQQKVTTAEKVLGEPVTEKEFHWDIAKKLFS